MDKQRLKEGQGGKSTERGKIVLVSIYVLAILHIDPKNSRQEEAEPCDAYEEHMDAIGTAGSVAPGHVPHR